jgi:hypothetical protein
LISGGAVSYGQRDLKRQHLVYVKGKVLLHKAFEVGRFRHDRVSAHGQIINAVLPITVGLSRLGEPGIQVGRLHRGRADQRPGRVLHRSYDSAGNLLRPYRQQARKQ